LVERTRHLPLLFANETDGGFDTFVTNDFEDRDDAAREAFLVAIGAKPAKRKIGFGVVLAAAALLLTLSSRAF